MTLESLYKIADENGIPVFPFPLGDMEAASVMTLDGRSCIGIDPDRLISRQDEKVKLAHELGHAIQGAYYNQFATCDVWMKQENKANRWAYQHLVKEKDLREAVKNGSTEVWELAELFDVPPDVMAKICHWHKFHNFDFTA